MEIRNAAVAGTLESSDCMVSIEPAGKGIELEIESAVYRQYGKKDQRGRDGRSRPS